MNQPQCPFCHSTDVVLHSMIGSKLLLEQYYCNTCRTVFEYVRDDEADDEQSTRIDQPRRAHR